MSSGVYGLDGPVTSFEEWIKLHTEHLVHEHAIEKSGQEVHQRTLFETLLQKLQRVSHYLEIQEYSISYENLRKIQAMCLSMVDSIRKSGLRRMFWNLFHQKETRELENIDEKIESLIHQKNPIHVVSFNMGSSTDDYETVLAHRHKHIREYKQIQHGKQNHVRYIRKAVKRAIFYKDNISADLIDTVLRLEELSPYAHKKMAQEIRAIFTSSSRSKTLDFLEHPLHFEHSTIQWIRNEVCYYLDRIVSYILEKMRFAPEKEVTDLLLHEKNYADVFFLQEVGMKDRSLIQALQAKGYTIIYPQGRESEAAIGVDSKRFTIEKSESYDSFPICIVSDRVTRKRCMLVSAHIHGITGEELEHDAAFGDKDCEDLLSRLQEIQNRESLSGTPIQEIIIGANLNAELEKWKRRFDIFEMNGFMLARTGKFTNICTQDATKKESDYFFSKSIRKYSRTQSEMNARICYGIQFRPDKHISDHLPIRAKITFTA